MISLGRCGGALLLATALASACGASSPAGATDGVGCEVATNGVCGVIWSFPPITASELEMDCRGQYQVVVSP
jgi:hypothetical protein